MHTPNAVTPTRTHYHTPALLHHARQCGFGCMKHGREQDGDDGIPLVFWKLMHWCYMLNAGIVYQNVQ